MPRKSGERPCKGRLPRQRGLPAEDMVHWTRNSDSALRPACLLSASRIRHSIGQALPLCVWPTPVVERYDYWLLTQHFPRLERAS